MMISPESFTNELENKTYAELLIARDELLEEIRSFEEHSYDPSEDLIHPSPGVRYQCNLEYLGKLFCLISEKYNREFVWGEAEEDEHYLFILREYLTASVDSYGPSAPSAYVDRCNGKSFSLKEHIKGLIYSQLTPQRPWSLVVPHLKEIDEIFFGYDPEKLKAKPGSYFNNKISEIKCSNRSFAASMNALADNIRIFEAIEKEYGSMDAFVTSASAYDIVQKLSGYDSKYKLKQIGPALAWEYIRNVGIDGAKPDEHLCRFLGADRMGTGTSSPASIKDVLDQVEVLSNETGLTKTELDRLIWTFCSDGNGEICTKIPHCSKCPIKAYCKKGRN